MSEPRIIYAQSVTGEVVAAASVPRDMQVYCLECGTELILHRGAVLLPHFAHRASAACRAETAEHLAAKRCLSAFLQSHPGTLKVRIACTGYLEQSGAAIPCPTNTWTERELKLPQYDRVVEESPLGSYVLDVAASNQGATCLAVELRHTSPVSREKRQYLNRQPLTWLEFTTQTVAATPPPWSVAESSLGRAQCPACVATRIPAPHDLDKLQLELLSDVLTFGADHAKYLGRRYGPEVVETLLELRGLRSVPTPFSGDVLVLGAQGRRCAGLSPNYVTSPDRAQCQYDRRRVRESLETEGWTFRGFAARSGAEPALIFTSSLQQLLVFSVSIPSAKSLARATAHQSAGCTVVVATRNPGRFRRWAAGAGRMIIEIT